MILNILKKFYKFFWKKRLILLVLGYGILGIMLFFGINFISFNNC